MLSGQTWSIIMLHTIAWWITWSLCTTLTSLTQNLCISTTILRHTMSPYKLWTRAKMAGSKLLLSLYSQVGPDCKVNIFPKDELDKANKDKKHYPAGFQVWDLYASCKHVWSNKQYNFDLRPCFPLIKTIGIRKSWYELFLLFNLYCTPLWL